MGWVVGAVVVLGFLVGQIVGMTSASVTTSIIGLLFTFAGGTAIGLLHKLTPEQRRLAAMAIAILSFSCTVGIYTGIVVTEHHLLSPKPEPGAPPAAPGERDSNTYLRNQYLKESEQIDQQYRTKVITAETAVKQLVEMARRKAKDRDDANR